MSATANIDLHCHSQASDGALTPTELVAHAHTAGIQHLALTDHDTVDGLDEARSAAQALGLGFINGVEFSVAWQRRTLHVVGLGFAPNSASILSTLATIQAARAERARAMAEKVERAGVGDAHSRAEVMSAGGQVTRTHFARLLVEDGVAKDLKQAFKRYLGVGKPAYVSGEWLELETAVAAIRSAGGVAVLAHPLRYKFTAAWRERMLAAFVDAGGEAVEVSAGSSQQPADIAEMTKAAQRFSLLGSVASDFHGLEQHWVPYGRLQPLPPSVTPVWDRYPELLA